MSAEHEKVVISKPPRDRSPQYPFISLKVALERAKEFYAKERRNAAPVSIAVTHWKYKPKSSGGIQTIAALKSYGLLTDKGSGAARTVQLTESAWAIIRDERTVSAERDAAIKQAALRPKIHATLWQKYGMTEPSPETLRHYLRFDLKFNDNAVGDFIREYKETISFAKMGDSDTVTEVEGDSETESLYAEGQTMQNQPVTQPQGSQTFPRAPLTGKPVGQSIPVTKNCTMSILATGEVTQKGLEQIISYINLIKGSFPEDESAGAN